MKVRGDITFSHLIFLVSHYRKLSLELFGLSKFSVSKKILQGRERGKSRFSVAFYLYRSFENLQSERIVVSENFWQGKIFHESEMGYHVFPSSFPRLILPKTSFGNSSSLQIIYGSEKIVLRREGDMTFFSVEKFLNHSTGNFYWEFLGVSEIFWYGKKHMIKMGVSQISAKHFLSHNAKKVHWKLFGVSKYFW